MNDPAEFAVLRYCRSLRDHDPHRWYGVRPRRRAYWCTGAPVTESSNAERKSA